MTTRTTNRPSVAGIIPARHASTRLPGKPLIDLCGQPMIRRVYERAARSRVLTRVIVATDHPGIAGCVAAFGGEAVMTPPELRTGSDRIAFVAAGLEGTDIVVNIQGDEPLIEPDMIDEAVAPLLRDPSIEAGTLVSKITSARDIDDPNVVKALLDREGFAIAFSRAPVPYLRNGSGGESRPLRHDYYKHVGLYVFRRDFLLAFAQWPETPLERAEQLEQMRIIEHGRRIKATLTGFESIPVDTPADAEKVRRMLMEREGAVQR